MRELGVEGRVSHLYLGSLVESGNELVRMLLEGLDVTPGAVLHIKLHTTTGAITHDSRLGEGKELRTVDIRRAAVDVSDDSTDVVLLVGTFVPVLQLDDEHTSAGGLSAHHTVARHVRITLNLRYVLDAGLHLFHRLHGLREAASGRRGDIDKHSTHVLVGDETCLRVVHQHGQQSDGSHHTYPNEPLATEEPHHAALVAQHEPVERSLESMVETTGEAEFLSRGKIHMGCHEQGAQCRTGRQGINSRETDGHRHRKAELHVERTRCSTHERSGDEHGHEDERRGDDGGSNTVHRTVCCLVRRADAVVKLRLYGFDHDDGVIHDSTDNQHQRKECQQV